jgi:hypothetical protein
VVQAMLAASSTLAGVVVVFQGFLLSIYSGLGVGVDNRVKTPYRLAILGVLLVVVVSLLASMGAIGWLLGWQLGIDLFSITVALFLLLLTLLLVASISVTYMVTR